MKYVARITRRLMSVFLVLVASSMMFLSFPAVAATLSSVTLTNENSETEVLKSDKPVIVILSSKYTLEGFEISLEELKSKAENFFGDKYKIAVGNIEDTLEISEKVPPTPRIFPPLSTVSVFKSREVIVSKILYKPKDPTGLFEAIKDSLA